MTQKKTIASNPGVVLFIVLLIGLYWSIPAKEPGFLPIADVNIGSSGIYWQPNMGYASAELRIGCPDGPVFYKTFTSMTTPSFDLSDLGNRPIIDGPYTYELRLIPQMAKKSIRSEKDMLAISRDAGRSPARAHVLTGYFRVQGNAIMTDRAEELPARPMDVVHADDVIVTGSICVGFDCVDGESFVLDTIKLKENTLRIFFDDTSTSVGFPANDWRLVTNDSTSGGGNYFAIEDTTGGSAPFKVEAGAPSGSLFIDDAGRVGLGTSLPVLDLHLLSGNSPAIRLEQDGSSGWTAQTWDMGGNEANFFIRDVTGGSKMPFRIQPGTPSSTLTMKSDGKVGIGTWTPAYKVDMQTTGENCVLAVTRSAGASIYVNATDTYANFGSINDFPTRIAVNSIWRARFNNDNSLTMASNATCTAGGAWTNASSITLKENIQALSAREAIETLNNLNPVKFNYKVDKEEQHVGFIAEDVPDLVASKDRKGMSPMDVTAVLTQVVKEQQKKTQAQEEMIQEQQKLIEAQQKTISALNERLSALEEK